MIRRSSGTHAGKPSAQHSKHLKSSTSVFPSSTLNSFRMTSWFSTCCTLASVQFHSANLAYTKLVRLNLRTMWSWNLKMFFVGSFCGWEKPLCLFLSWSLMIDTSSRAPCSPRRFSFSRYYTVTDVIMAEGQWPSPQPVPVTVMSSLRTRDQPVVSVSELPLFPRQWRMDAHQK